MCSSDLQLAKAQGGVPHAINYMVPSWDGRRLAYGVSAGGSEDASLHVIEVATGRDTGLVIPDKVEAPHWLPDGSGFVYRNLKDPDDPYSGQVRFHRLGAPIASDALLFRQFTKDEDAALATTWGPGATLSDDGGWLLLTY